MIGHYFFTALLNMKRAPLTTAAKVLTLAVGLLAMVLALSVITYWRSTDEAILTTDGRPVVFTEYPEGADPDRLGGPIIWRVRAEHLREYVPELLYFSRFRGLGEVLAESGDRTVGLTGFNVDPEFLDIFQFDFLEGDPGSALANFDGLVLTEIAAQRLFGETPALGQPVLLGGQRSVVVSGVIAAPPAPTIFSNGRFEFDYLSVVRPRLPDEGDGGQEIAFGVFPAGTDLTSVDLRARLNKLSEDWVPESFLSGTDDDRRWLDRRVGARDIDHLPETLLRNGRFRLGESPATVPGILLSGALLVLVIASFNYVVLAVAEAASRIGEVGMRRTLGANRIELLLQGWIEAALATVLSLLLVGLALVVVEPAVAAQAGADIIGPAISDPAIVGAAILAGLIVALFAGASPVLAAASARPADALRSARSQGASRGALGLLVGFQFAVASFLLTVLIVVSAQNQFVRQAALTPDNDPVVVLPSGYASGIDLETLRTELSGYPQIVAVGGGVESPWVSSQYADTLRTSASAGAIPIEVELIGTNYGYFGVYGQDVVAGRVFDPEREGFGRRGAYFPDRPVAPEPIVIDRAMSASLGFDSPQAAINKTIPNEFGPPNQVIGVVEDRLHNLRAAGSDGYVYHIDPLRADTPLIRISADDVEGGMAAIGEAWSKLSRGRPLTYRFEDEIFDQAFKTYEQTGKLVAALSAMAFAICMIGMFAMALHVTRRRRHEIAVRRSLGSSVPGAVGLLLADFSKPVIVANLIAWPLAYFAAQVYLNPFAYRIELSIWPFAASMLITLAIAWLAVGGQTFKAASVRPAQVLRDA